MGEFPEIGSLHVSNNGDGTAKIEAYLNTFKLEGLSLDVPQDHIEKSRRQLELIILEVYRRGYHRGYSNAQETH